jgi:hypothetical protein
MVDISNWNDLDSIRNSSETQFTLTQDLDSNTAGYSDVASGSANNGAGWNPIANFDGTFNGNGNTISDLVIDRPNENAGLILATSGTIKNTTFSNVDITVKRGGTIVRRGSPTLTNCSVTGNISGEQGLGGMVGFAESGTDITTASVDVTISIVEAGDGFHLGGIIGQCKKEVSISGSSGTVAINGEKARAAGGLVGQADIDANSTPLSITNSSASGSISGDRELGGLIGDAEAIVEDCTADVSLSGNRNLGGIIGILRSEYGSKKEVIDSHTTGTVTGTRNLGGFIGNANGKVTNCYAEGDVESTSNERNIGGLIGLTSENNTITDSHAIGTVTGGDSVGGLIGLLDDQSTITNCYAKGDASGVDTVGGLVGDSGDSITIKQSHAIGTVTGTAQLGGLVGRSVGDITSCYAEGNVTANSGQRKFVGGLIGEANDGDSIFTVQDSYATGNVAGEKRIGGLIGAGKCDISGCHAEGDVTGNAGDKEYIGGLIGEQERGFSVTPTIEASYSIGSVTGTDRVGGLAGEAESKIVESYSTGKVTGTETVGGFVGEVAQATVNDCYSTSSVTAKDDTEDSVGGFVGVAEGEVSRCYAAGKITENQNVNGFGKKSFSADGSPIKSSYWDKVATGISADRGSGEKLTTPQMTGERASENMTEFDFTDTWSETIGDGSDSTPTDGYPILQAIDASVQRTDAIFLQPPSAPSELTVIPA